MGKALEQAEKALSRDEFPVGCVLVHDERIIATGARAGTAKSATNEVDHAEMIALRRLNESATAINPGAITVYCTLEPCLMCYGAILIAGIRHIVYAYEDAMGGGTQCDLKLLPPLYREAMVSIVPHVCRNESLRLFKAFFDNPDNTYLADTYLAVYTRDQLVDF